MEKGSEGDTKRSLDPKQENITYYGITSVYFTWRVGKIASFYIAKFFKKPYVYRYHFN